MSGILHTSPPLIWPSCVSSSLHSIGRNFYFFFPEGPAAHQWLADSRAARIRGERAARPAPTFREQQAAREARAAARRQAALDRDIDEFMSTNSVRTSDPVRLENI